MTTTTRRLTAIALSLATLAAATAMPARAAVPYDITVNAGTGGQNSLKGRRYTAYKLADYVDGTYVSVGDKQLDGVAVDTPTALETHLDRVLAATTGKAVDQLPGWKDSGKDPIAWMGGFRQNTGSDQTAGTFGFGWNESGAQHIGNNSPDKAYVGSVREFADNLVKDQAALAAVEAQPHSQTVDCQTGDSCVIPLTAAQGSGIYLILDTAGESEWTGKDLNGWNNTWSTGVTQPMIVPTRPDDKDVATLDGYKPSDRNNLGTVGALGEITVKNVTDYEVIPPCTPPEGENPPSENPPDCVPKHRDTSTAAGKDADDNASDLGDTVPYEVTYRTPDLSAYRNAYDNRRDWIYNYRIIDQTTPGLKITAAPTVTIPGIDGKTITVPLTKVDQIPDYAADGTGTKDGQADEPDAWYYLASDKDDSSKLVIGLGRWMVKNYGDLAANDKSKTLYGHVFTVKYSATVTKTILDHQNMAHNENWVEYSNNPSDVESGKVTVTPHVIVKQWTYDVDLHKRASTSNIGLEGAKFQVTVKDNANESDAKTNGSVLKFVATSDTKGDYRLAVTGETGSTTVTTGKDGLLRLRGLDLGTYTLTETEAPHDYQPLKHSEDVTVSAKFADDKTDWITPNAQTEAKLTITKNNSIIPLLKPMFNFAVTQDKAPAGLTITSTSATWSGKDKSGAYYADDKTSWIPADLTLWNQPINVMLAKTGGRVAFGMLLAIGVLSITGGIILIARRRDDTRER